MDRSHLINKLDKANLHVKSISDKGNSLLIIVDDLSRLSDHDFKNLFPLGTYSDKDVIMSDGDELNESYSLSHLLNESTPHPYLIEEGDRVTINHKTFGDISVIVKTIKRYNKNNELDGFYWTSKRKGIMGFSSFDNIQRLYKESNKGMGKNPKNWNNHNKRVSLGYLAENENL